MNTSPPSIFTGYTANFGPISSDTPIYLRQSVLGLYFSDQWRTTSRLTLNLGMRYEMSTVPTERYNRLATLSSLTAAAPTLGSPYFNNPTLLDFSPRVGFAWDPFGKGKTAVRGGFGIYDNLPLTYDFTLLSLNAAPFFQTGTISSGLNGKFPNQAASLLTPATQKEAFVQQNPGRMYVMQWNFNIQHDLGWGLVGTAGYNGSHGVHQPSRANDENIVLPTSFLPNGTPVWPFPKGSGARQDPNVGAVDSIIWNGSSIYHAMLLNLTRQQKKGVRIGASYTWSKSIDDSSSTVGGSNFNNSLVSPWIQFPGLFRGLSDFDQRYNFTGNVLWEVPTPATSGFVRTLSSGWQISGIYRIAAGLPFTPTIGGDPLGLRNSNAFGLPDRKSTPNCQSLVNPGNPNHYIKTECFTLPTAPAGVACTAFAAQAGTCSNLLGNSRRNVAIGPGVTTLDMSLAKSTHLGERVTLQLRFEAFNVLTHANFRTPDRTVAQLFNVNGTSLAPAIFGGTGNAGVITSTSTTSRQLQLAMKVIF